MILLPCLMSLTNAAVLNVDQGDATDLSAVLASATEGDVILIPPGFYAVNDDLCESINSNTHIIIRGTGATPLDTKLIGAVFHYCNSALVIENLSIYGSTCNNDPIVEEDSDDGTLLRNCVVYSSPASSYAFDIMSHRLGFINTNIFNMIPGSGSSGITDEGNGLVMLNSKLEGFDTALHLNNFYYSDNPVVDYKISKTNLSNNDIQCHICTSYSQCADSCAQLSQLAPNTPAGNKYTISSIIDILRFKPGYGSTPGTPYIPVQIFFTKVKTAGETTAYRLPSAYPVEPAGLNLPTGKVQYYQFDSTAILGKNAILYFDKAAIDAEFPVSSSIKIRFRNGSAWSTIATTVVTRGGIPYYSITFPTLSLTGIIAFFS